MQANAAARSCGLTRAAGVSRTSIGCWNAAIKCMARIILLPAPRPWRRVYANGSITNPANGDRQIGWVTLETDLYYRPVQRIAVRCRKKNGQWRYGVILSTLAPQDVLRLTGGYEQEVDDPQAVLLAYVHFYDERGGGVEIEIKEDKQGLSTSKRNKKRFEAQQVLIQLEALVHNVLIWGRGWLTPRFPKIICLGIKHLVREVFQINDFLFFAQSVDLLWVALNRVGPYGGIVFWSGPLLLTLDQVIVIFSET